MADHWPVGSDTQFGVREPGAAGDEKINDRWAFPCMGSTCPECEFIEHREPSSNLGRCPIDGCTLVDDDRQHYHYYGRR